ncbi:MAG: truncated hemoglobin [Methyloceanibacter sp.]|uniref:truncated hemoglobin n=1 Tax=Methyloceanibacter sp. TaxID=1965321 RepID=UPI003D6D9431
MSRSLFDKIGGFGAVSGIVLNFYDKVLESEVVAPYFASVDMPRLINHQTRFICSLLGGPASIPDEQIRHVHRSMGISSAAFDQAVALFRESLHEAKLDEPDVERAVALFEAKRSLVVRG